MAELRAFPRLSCAIAAKLHIGPLTMDAQMVDISRGGCKVMPVEITEIHRERPQVGEQVAVAIDAGVYIGSMAWATPNYSALGCKFEPPMSDLDMLTLASRFPAAMAKAS
jgi:hypothetical protein